MSSVRSSIIAFIVVSSLSAIHRVHGEDFIFGGEAKRVCDAYKLICPAKKVCALQSIEWPRAMKFPVCVRETHVVVKSNICRKPPIPGKCKARFMRWYFNVHMGACSWFTYSGCGGNQNKFRTAEACERRCMDADKDNSQELTLRRHRNKIENSSRFESVFDVHDKDLVQSKELKLITPPAKAADMIDFDVTEPLQLGAVAKNITLSTREEKRRQKKERERMKRQKNKRRKKNRKNGLNKTRDIVPKAEPDPELTIVELDPNFDEDLLVSPSDSGSEKFAELTGRQTTVSKIRKYDPNAKLIWRMDRQFTKRRRRHQNKFKDHESKPRIDTKDSYSGAKQETYYEKVKLFDILKNQEEVENTKQI